MTSRKAFFSRTSRSEDEPPWNTLPTKVPPGFRTSRATSSAISARAVVRIWSVARWPVVGAANIQLATCSPNFLILESIERWDGFQAQILKKPVRWESGYVIPPAEPGLGIELNEEVIAKHPYTGTRLHLEMADDPIGVEPVR